VRGRERRRHRRRAGNHHLRLGRLRDARRRHAGRYVLSVCRAKFDRRRVRRRFALRRRGVGAADRDRRRSTHSDNDRPEHLPEPAAAGQSVTLPPVKLYRDTIHVPHGAVTFTDTTTGNVLGTANLQTSGSGVHVSTSASITTSSLAAGAHTLQAAYPGNGLYGPSTSQYIQVIQAAVPPVRVSRQTAW